jgi:hypothetical protein
MPIPTYTAVQRNNNNQRFHVANKMGKSSCMHGSSESSLIWLHVSYGWCVSIYRLPANHLLLACQKNGSQAYIMSSLLWFLYIKVVHPIIDSYWFSTGVASSITLGWFDLHLKKTQHHCFPHIGLSANISSMHYAGQSTSTQNPRITINHNWSDKQQQSALLA